MPPTEKTARASAFVLGHRSSQYPNAPVNLVFQGDAGIPAGFFEQDRNNFAPRLGLAWDVTGDGKTAIRGGAGIYYSFANMNIPMWNSERTPWEPSAIGGETTSLRDPWRTSRTVRYAAPPTPFNRDVSNFAYPPRIRSLLGYDPGWRTPYTAQWSFSVERQIASGISVQAAYVANRGIGFTQLVDGDYPIWSPTATLQNAENRRPIPGYGLVEILQSRARSWYDSLRLSADFRRIKGLNSRLTYVYGKNLAVEAEDRGQGGDRSAKPLKLDNDKGGFGRRQVARVFFVYDLPLFTKPRNFDAQPGDRPDVTGSIGYTSGSRAGRMARFFDTTVFRNPTVGNTFGNLSRNAIVGPGMWDADAAMLKNFRLTELRYLQFRAEAYNVFNHPNLNNPVTTMRSVDFGLILNISGNRTMQIGLRFVF